MGLSALEEMESGAGTYQDNVFIITEQIASDHNGKIMEDGSKEETDKENDDDDDDDRDYNEYILRISPRDSRPGATGVRSNTVLDLLVTDIDENDSAFADYFDDEFDEEEED